jgi:ubiquinone/menaquinone biosynthesis C-methylase UbiE
MAESRGAKTRTRTFDTWPERYDQWFKTPIGRLVKIYETELILKLLKAGCGEKILDAGCGTGVFTADILAAGSCVVGLDISEPMLSEAGRKARGYPFRRVLGDIGSLPFPDQTFDKVVSVTALGFLQDIRVGIRELFRVARKGGCVVVAMLNSRSPWAVRRRAEAKERPDSLFRQITFRSPEELEASVPVRGVIKTAIHFQRDDDPERAKEIESAGRLAGLNTGAFMVGRWERP